MILDLAFLMSEQILIPFLFVLAIVFGFLDVFKIFGRNIAVNFLIALAIAFFSISSEAFVNFLWTYFGSITIFFIIMFLLAFVLEIFGLRKGKRENTSIIIIYGGILFVLLSLWVLSSKYAPELPYIGSGQNLLFLIAIIFVLAIFWAAFKIGKHGGEPKIVPVPVRGGYQISL